MSGLLNLSLEKALKLPQGEIQEEELKKIPNIFSNSEVEVALKVINELGDYDDINTKADILERAYRYGLYQKKKPKNSTKGKKITPEFCYFVVCGIIVMLCLGGGMLFLQKKSLKLVESYQEEVIENQYCSLNKRYCLIESYRGRISQKSLKILLQANLVDTKSNKIILNQDSSIHTYPLNLFLKKKNIEKDIRQFFDQQKEKKQFISERGNLLTIKEIKEDWTKPYPIEYPYSLFLQIVSDNGRQIIEYRLGDIAQKLGLDAEEIEKVVYAGYYKPEPPRQISAQLVELDLMTETIRVNIDTAKVSKAISRSREGNQAIFPSISGE